MTIVEKAYFVYNKKDLLKKCFEGSKNLEKLYCKT